MHRYGAISVHTIRGLMIKQCAHCSTVFNTYDSRRKACTQTCANVLRKANSRPKHYNVVNEPKVEPKRELPPPEELPAPYAKRVYDMWAALIGADAPVRIA